ncbi:MAG: glycosyltransferase family 39 protein [Parcubacteria group bacterium]|nr:glycosyltransferase family 39 protein [Parcubacteria group bacterium]
MRVALSENVLRKYWPLLAIIILFFAFRVPFLPHELGLEESSLISTGVNILRTGFPAIDADMFSRYDVWAVGHPPLISFLLALFLKLFGVSEAAARLMPLTISFLLFLSLWWFSLRLFQSQAISAIATILFSVIPFSVQNSLHIHYDGAIISFLVFWILVASWYILASGVAQRRHYVWFFAAALGLFYSKPEAWSLVWFFIIGFVVLGRFGRTAWKNVGALLLLWLSAGGLFFSSFYLYNHSFGYGELTAPFTFTILGLTVNGFLVQKIVLLSRDFGAGIQSFASNAALLYKTLIWLLLPTILLVILSGAKFFVEGKWRDKKILFVAWGVFVFSVPYFILGYGGNIYPRYVAPMMPWASLLVAYFVSRYLVPRLFYVGLLYAVGILVALRVTGLWHYLLPFRGDIVFGEATRVLALWLFIVMGSFIFIVRRPQFSASFLSVLFMLTVILSSIIFIVDARASYSTADNFGEYGYRETGEWLNRNTTKEDIVLGRNPLEYYFHGNIIDTYHSLTSFRNRIQELLGNRSITLLAIPERTMGKWKAYDQQGGRFIYEYIQDRRLPEIQRFGSIIIYKNQ